MAKIKMDLDEIVDVSIDMRSISNELNDNFESISKMVEGTREIYKSAAIDEWIDKYHKTRESQKSLIDAINSCAQYFADAAGVLENVEENLKKSVDNLPTNNIGDWK